jgi:UDP-4-amino-4,6-dideoxy-N-acetyl-beta-L-altrosamine N-acetyltransferase
VEQKILLERVRKEHLADLLRIRNSHHVRVSCWETEEISEKRHREWYNSVKRKKQIKQFAIMLGDRVVGACSLRIGKSKSAEFSIFIDKKHCGSGFGKQAMKQLIDFGFEEVGLHKIWGMVFDFNIGALEMYKKIGFEVEGKLREHLYRDGKYYDVYFIGIIGK